MSVKTLVFFTPERPRRRALREYCHGRNIKELIVLRPSDASHGQYVCYASRFKGFFVNYTPETVARKMKFARSELIKTSLGGRRTTNKLLFYCFVDTKYKAEFTSQIYFTHGVFPKAVAEFVMLDAMGSQLTVSESHPITIDRIRRALPGEMVNAAVSEVIRQGTLPEIGSLTLVDSSDESEC